MRDNFNNSFQKEYTCAAGVAISGLHGFTKYWFEVENACNLTVLTRYGSEDSEALEAGDSWVYEGPCQGFSVSANTKVFVTAV